MHNDVIAPEVSRHKCLIYQGQPTEQLPVVIPFLKSGLQNNWRCLYLGSPEMLQIVDSALRNTGLDAASEMKRGALLFSSERSHLASGKFDARAMVDGLCELIDGALQDGFEGLCATGDMKWELGPDKNFDLLIEYEALLEQVFRRKPLIGICQYHRDLIPARALRDALITHRSTYIGDTLNQDNLFYMPPEVLIENRDGEPDLKQGEWMCQQIMRVLKAEQTRDKALTALAAMNQDLERRIKERTAELEIANRHLEAFSYSVSHDLRAPLRQITGFTSILSQEHGPKLEAGAQEHLASIQSAARRMAQLIDALLDMGKMEKAPVQLKKTDLNSVVQSVLQDIRPELLGREIEWRIDALPTIECDPQLIRCVFTNLLSNAVKYTRQKKQAAIQVGTDIVNGSKTIFVRDNGAGFDPKYADKLFGVFQRLHLPEEFEGTGVGLATVHRILERHGWRIWAEAEVEKGATFFFTIDPVRQSAQVAHV